MEHLSTLSQVVFKGDHIYHHHLFRVNYTAYDVRRAQDTINPRTDHRDIIAVNIFFVMQTILAFYMVNITCQQ